MFRRLAKLVATYPRWILGAWLLIVGVALPFASRVGTVLDGQPDIPPGSVAAEVRQILQERFPDSDDNGVVLIARFPQPANESAGELGSEGAPPATGASAATEETAEPTTDAGGVESGGDAARARAERFADVVAAVESVPGVAEVRTDEDVAALDLTSAGASFSAALISLEGGDLPETTEVVHRIRSALTEIDGLDATLAGGPATFEELQRVSKRDTRRAELFGLPLSLLVLLIAFGAVMASLLPLLVAATTVVVSLAGLTLLGAAIDFAVFTQSLVTIIGLATGIDYALLFVNRYREELRRGLDPRSAAERTTATAGRAVAFSGSTVLIALAALLVPPLAFIRSLGIGLILVLVIAVTVSLTFLPALLALLGHRVNWLRLTRREPGTRSRRFWRARADAVMRRPVAWAVGGSLALVLLALPAFWMQVADPGALGLSERTDARRTVEALGELDLEGLLDPLEVLVDFGEEGFFRPPNVRDLASFVRAVEEEPEVDVTLSPFAAPGVPRLFLYQYYARADVARTSEVAPLVAATVGEGDRYALVRIYPNDSLTPSESNDLRRRLRALAADEGLDVRIGGNDVFEAEWARTLYRSFPLAISLVCLATLVLLGLAFRSLLIPLKSIALNALTVGAAYGVITLIYQMGIGTQLVGMSGGLGFIDTSAPLFIFAVTFGLSMDYEVFLVARIYEAHQRGASDAEAVRSALSATGGVITSAALIMLVVFSTFIFSEVVLIKTLGTGLAVAVLLDATLVRVALVPAVMALAGRWNWWLPRPVRWLADRLGLSHD